MGEEGNGGEECWGYYPCSLLFPLCTLLVNLFLLQGASAVSFGLSFTVLVLGRILIGICSLFFFAFCY
jgi:hypothetical protein